MSEKLPERPNLEQLKKQAKSLLHAAKANDATAIQRFATLPAFAKNVGCRTRGARPMRCTMRNP